MAYFLSQLTILIIHIISTLGYGGVVFLMALHSSAIPVPSEVVMPFTGYLVSQGRFNYFGVAIAGTVGNLIGGSFIFWIIRTKGKQFIERYERYVFVSVNDITLAENFFNKFGSVAVFLGRCIPIVATFISIPAGLSKIKYWKFAVFTFLGAIIWNLALTYIGFRLGENWMSLRDKLHGLETGIALVIFVAIIWWVWRHVNNRKK